MTRHATPLYRPFAAVPVLISLTLVLGARTPAWRQSIRFQLDTVNAVLSR